MALYEYTARDETGAVFSGIYEGLNSVSALKDELAKIGCRLVRAKKIRAGKFGRGKIKQADIVTFTYKFAGMCGAGLSIIQCLDTLEKQTENQALQYIIGDIRKNVAIGSSLTDAFGKYRDIFSDFFLGMIEAGEAGGRLAESLDISANYLEKKAELAGKLKSAFTYPIVVMIMCLIIITALVIFVVPVFSRIYARLGASLPGPTQALIFLSVVMRRWWPLLIVSIVGIVVLCKYLRRNIYVRSRWDHFKFRMPVFGKLNRLVATANFVRSFAMLILTGVPIIKAFQVASLVVNNEKISQISLEMQKSVQAGNSVSESFARYDLFPPIIAQLAGSGEQAGMLGQMLNKGVDFMEKDIERITRSLLVKLEPALTLGTGAVIGLILMAVYLPMFDYMSHIR